MTAAALGCPAMSVRYPARSTTTAAASIRRLRRASRNRRLPVAGAGADGRALDIGLEATTVPGSGQVQVHLQLPGQLPIPRRGPAGGDGPLCAESVLIRGQPWQPAAIRRLRGARWRAHTGV